MPKTQINYSNTQIYKLIHNDDINNENIYIGSTTNFVKRKYQHKYNCINEKSKNYNLKAYENIRNNGGWSEWTMLLVEKFPCTKKTEADVRERYWIDNFKSQLNVIIPSRTIDEWRNDNKEKITEQVKEYYEKNKIEILEKIKEYANTHKEEILYRIL